MIEEEQTHDDPNPNPETTQQGRRSDRHTHPEGGTPPMVVLIFLIIFAALIYFLNEVL